MEVEHSLGTAECQFYAAPEGGHPSPVGVDLSEHVSHGSSRQELCHDHVGLLLCACPQKLHSVWMVDLLEHVQLRPEHPEGADQEGAGVELQTVDASWEDCRSWQSARRYCLRYRAL